jgi:hypothetical protein
VAIAELELNQGHSLVTKKFGPFAEARSCAVWPARIVLRLEVTAIEVIAGPPVTTVPCACAKTCNRKKMGRNFFIVASGRIFFIILPNTDS